MKAAFRRFSTIALFFFLQRLLVFAQPVAKKVFFLEDVAAKQWCAFRDESAWRAAVQNARSMQVGVLIYSNNRLSQVDVTEEDETGDWAVNDRYSIDDRGRIARLSRTINVIPGDRSALQRFSIRDGKAKLAKTISKQLRTGKTLIDPAAVWLPQSQVTTNTKKFPFSALLESRRIKTAGKFCVRETEAP